jgi:hypothetical protein
MKKRVLMLMQLFYGFVQAQVHEVTHSVDLEKRSFAKGRVHKLRLNDGQADSVVFSKDTLIGERLYYKWKITNHYLYAYWYEADDGRVWMHFPYFNTGEILYIPKNPFVGYTFHYGNFEVRIIGIQEQKMFGNVMYDNLIVFEKKYSDSDEESTYIEYFKKGVGWVANEGKWGTTYLESIEYR